jgi:protein-disulfide isomerase
MNITTRKFFINFAVLCLSVSLSVVAGAEHPQASKAPAIDEKQFETLIEKYLDSTKGQDKILSVLQSAARRQQEEAQKKETENQFKNRAQIDIGSSPFKGPADAKITIVEFSDFQCPHCKRGAQTMEEVMEAYPNQVKLVFKNIPLQFHKQAMPAAKAALAAAKQGKFWEMHDMLFENQGSLGDAFYVEAATKLGLDVEKFKTDMASPEVEAQVKADQEQGEKNGIQGTPGFFVNGVAVKGAYPLDHFKGIIDRLLAEK